MTDFKTIGHHLLAACSQVRVTTALAGLLLALSMPALPALAEEDNDLARAVDAWLDDRDDIALPALAELAKVGNEDAMLLLSQISKRPGALSPFMLSLGTKERNAFLKAPGGKFGVPWLKKVSEENRLGEALRLVQDPFRKAEGAKLLLDLGESGEAGRMISQLYNAGYFERIPIFAKHPNFPDEFKLLAWFSSGNALLYRRGVTREIAMKSLAEATDAVNQGRLQGLIFIFTKQNILPLHRRREVAAILDVGEFLSIKQLRPGWGDRSEETDRSRIASDILLGSAETRWMVDACRTICPENVRSCTPTLYGALGGYLGLIDVQSPLEKLVPRKRYFKSRRYRADLIRRSFEYGTFKTLEESDRHIDNCVAQAITEAVSEYDAAGAGDSPRFSYYKHKRFLEERGKQGPRE